MIATILPSSTTFHAVEYNERKVAKGQAVLLEMKNFGYVGAADGYTPEQLQQYLITPIRFKKRSFMSFLNRTLILSALI